MKLLRALKNKQTTRRNSSSSKLIRGPYVPIHLRHSHFECQDKSCQFCYSNKVNVSGEYLMPSDYSQLPTRRQRRCKSTDEDGSRSGSRSNSRCGNSSNYRYICNIDDLLRNEKFANAAGYGLGPSAEGNFSPPTSSTSKKRKRVSWQSNGFL